MLERAVDRPLEFNGTHITAGRLAQARGLGGDGLIVLCEFGSQLFRVGARALDDLLRVLAGRGKFAIPVPIDTDGIGGAEDAWLPDPRTGLIRLRDWPERSRNGRSGRNGDEMNVVGGFGDHPDDARLFDRAERRFDPLLADSQAVGVQFDAVRAGPGRSEDADGHAQQFAESSGQVAHAESLIDRHLREQSQADQHPARQETPAGILGVDLARIRIGPPRGRTRGIAGPDRGDAVAVIEQREPVVKCQHEVRLQGR